MGHEIKDWAGDGHSSEYTALDQHSTKELVAELKEHSRALIREEVRLAKLELANAKQELSTEADEARDLIGTGREFVVEAKTRLQEEVTLARRDLKEDLGEVKKAGASLATGGVLAHAGLYLLLFAAVFALDLVLPMWASALIVGAFVVIIGGGLAFAGKEKLSHVTERPMKRLNQRMKEDRRWMNDSTSSLREQTRETVRGLKAAMSETMRSVRSGWNANA